MAANEQSAMGWQGLAEVWEVAERVLTIPSRGRASRLAPSFATALIDASLSHLETQSLSHPLIAGQCEVGSFPGWSVT